MVIPGRKPREMTDHIDLAQLGHSGDAVPDQGGIEEIVNILGGYIEGGQIKGAPSRGAFLEDESFVETEVCRRSLVIILSDLVDRDASAELLIHTSKLIPRHLPLIVTIGDTDLRELVRTKPNTAGDVYQQGVAEEILRQREEALSRIRHAGGLALDVPARQLSIALVNKYLEVKERGLL